MKGRRVLKALVALILAVLFLWQLQICVSKFQHPKVLRVSSRYRADRSDIPAPGILVCRNGFRGQLEGVGITCSTTNRTLDVMFWSY